MHVMDERPELTKNISIKDFRDFYWCKEELVNFCVREKLNSQGGKIDLANTIEDYIQTGIIKEKE